MTYPPADTHNARHRQKNKSGFHKWPSSALPLPAMPSSVITRSSKLDSCKEEKLQGMKERQRESQKRRPSDPSLKTLIASLIIFLDARGRPDSWLPELLNSNPIEAIHSGGSNWAFFSRPRFPFNSPVLSLLVSSPTRFRAA